MAEDFSEMIDDGYLRSCLVLGYWIWGNATVCIFTWVSFDGLDDFRHEALQRSFDRELFLFYLSITSHPPESVNWLLNLAWVMKSV